MRSAMDRLDSKGDSVKQSCLIGGLDPMSSDTLTFRKLTQLLTTLSPFKSMSLFHNCVEYANLKYPSGVPLLPCLSQWKLFRERVGLPVVGPHLTLTQRVLI